MSWIVIPFLQKVFVPSKPRLDRQMAHKRSSVRMSMQSVDVPISLQNELFKQTHATLHFAILQLRLTPLHYNFTSHRKQRL